MTKASEDPQPRHADLMPRVPGQVPLTRISPRTVTAVVATVAIFLYLVRPILPPFVFSGIVAFICTPLVEAIASRTKAPRWLAATLVALAIVAVVGAFAGLVVPLLVREVADAFADLQGTLAHVAHWWLGDGQVSFLGQKVGAAEIARRAIDGLRSLIGQPDVVAGLAAGAVTGAIGLVLTVVLLFYFLIGGPSIAASLLWLAPPRQRPLVRAVWAQLAPVLTRYFLGLGVVVAYAVLVAYAGLGLILHLDNAIVLAIVTGVLEIVPVVGPVASAVIAGLAALHGATGIGRVITYAIYALALRLSIDQVVSPLVLGRAGRVHPVLIIFSFLAGGLLFGVVGIVLAIPVALAIKVVLATLYEEPLDPEHPETSKAIG